MSSRTLWMGSCDTIEWDRGQGARDTGRVELSANREMGKSAGQEGSG